MEELEANALDFFKNREYEKAANLYLQLAMHGTDNEKFLIAAANCYDALHDKKIASSLYKKALAINPLSKPALLNLSTLYYELQKYEKSITFALKVLSIDSKNFAALTNIGNAHYALGKYQEALLYYEKMYNLNPNSYNALLNIANTNYNLRNFKQALFFANLAIEKRPSSAEPYIVAGNIYIELFKNEQASNCLKRAADIAPNSEWLMVSISNLFQKMGNWQQCLHYAWKIFTLKGENASIEDHINFAYFLYEAKEENPDNKTIALVENYLSRWESSYPENTIVHHACCALRDIQEIKTMDLSYIKGLFDGFAPSFDDILNALEYHVPTFIAEELKNHLKTKLFKKRRILDLGCGTGLCAQALKAYFPNEEFYGVDISEKMLEAAEKKGLYKALYADDILSFLSNNEILFHAVVAGDVFTYMGDLKPLFSALTSMVKFNGYFVFSVSKNTINNANYYLMPSGRFVHSLSYVQRLLKYCGFKTLEINETVLRHEGARKVEGYVILAQKEIEVVFENES